MNRQLTEEDNLRELRAYKTGYDLGFFRGVESMQDKLMKIYDLLTNSATVKKIERENEELPVLIKELLAEIADSQEFRREMLPTLLLEKEAINNMGRRLEALPEEAYKVMEKIQSFEPKKLEEKGE